MFKNRESTCEVAIHTAVVRRKCLYKLKWIITKVSPELPVDEWTKKNIHYYAA